MVIAARRFFVMRVNFIPMKVTALTAQNTHLSTLMETAVLCPNAQRETFLPQMVDAKNVHLSLTQCQMDTSAVHQLNAQKVRNNNLMAPVNIFAQICLLNNLEPTNVPDVHCIPDQMMVIQNVLATIRHAKGNINSLDMMDTVVSVVHSPEEVLMENIAKDMLATLPNSCQSKVVAKTAQPVNLPEVVVTSVLTYMVMRKKKEHMTTHTVIHQEANTSISTTMAIMVIEDWTLSRR